MTVFDQLISMGFKEELALKAIASNGTMDFQSTAKWIISHANDPLLQEPTNLNYIVLLSLSPDSFYVQHILKQIYSSLSACDLKIPSTCDMYFSMPLTKIFKIENNKASELVNSFNKCAEIIKDLSQMLFWMEPIFSKNNFKCRLNEEAQSLIQKFCKVFNQVTSELGGEATANEQGPELVFTFVDGLKDGYLTQKPTVIQRVQQLINVLCSKRECCHRNGSHRDSESDEESGDLSQTNSLELVLNLLSFEDGLKHCKAYHRIAQAPLSCLMEPPATPISNWENSSHNQYCTNCMDDLGEVYYAPNNGHSENDNVLTVISCTDGLKRQFTRDSLQQIPKICAWNVISTCPITRGSVKDAELLTETDGAPNRQNRILSKLDFYRAFTRSQFTDTGRLISANWSIAQPQFNVDYSGEKDLVKRRYIIVRHGERTDQTFGHQWTSSVFTFKEENFYVYKDLNIPRILPKREHSLKDYIVDSPLTEIGMFEAFLTGDYMKKLKLFETINWVYSSPALRSVQTAHFILKGLGLVEVVKIRVEPVLFEWYGWYKKACPAFIKPSRLKECGFNIDTSYKCLLPHEEYNPEETLENYYRRGYDFMKLISDLHKNQGGDILITGHGGTLEVNTRQLLGRQPRDWNQFHSLLVATPYCAATQINEMSDGTWAFAPTPPSLPMTYNTNQSYDWTLLHH